MKEDRRDVSILHGAVDHYLRNIRKETVSSTDTADKKGNLWLLESVSKLHSRAIAADRAPNLFDAPKDRGTQMRSGDCCSPRIKRKKVEHEADLSTTPPHALLKTVTMPPHIFKTPGVPSPSLGSKVTHQTTLSSRPSRKHGHDMLPLDVTDEIILLYPPKGRGSINITNGDLSKLSPGDYLNDSLIELGLKLWLDDLAEQQPELARQVHVFSTFFYKKLGSNAKAGYPSVQKWTRKVDLFQKKYIIVPVHENFHWYLALIYKPDDVLPPFKISQSAQLGNDNSPANGTESRSKGKVRASNPEHLNSDNNGGFAFENKNVYTAGSRSDGRDGPAILDSLSQGHIFTLDSLGGRHASAEKKLNQYLHCEARDKKKLDVRTLSRLPYKAIHVPTQPNSVDCGVYLLHFVKKFMQNAEDIVAHVLTVQQPRVRPTDAMLNKYWDPDSVKHVRMEFRKRIEGMSAVWVQDMRTTEQNMGTRAVRKTGENLEDVIGVDSEGSDSSIEFVSDSTLRKKQAA